MVHAQTQTLIETIQLVQSLGGEGEGEQGGL